MSRNDKSDNDLSNDILTYRLDSTSSIRRTLPLPFAVFLLAGYCSIELMTWSPFAMMTTKHDDGRIVTTTSWKTETNFDNVHKFAYNQTLAEESQIINVDGERRTFNLTKWKTLYRRSGGGGLTSNDRILLGNIYSKANSVFEFGLGESTAIASYVGVPRYAGLDSHVDWITNVRTKVSPTFRFYFGDIGPTRAWGYPIMNLQKSVLTYQFGGLASELASFDVYMVDGRYRVACVLISFLHASAHGSYDPLVLLHDCYQEQYSPKNASPHRKRSTYYILNEYFDLDDHSKDFLCVYKRRTNVTDEQIYELWEKHYAEVY